MTQSGMSYTKKPPFLTLLQLFTYLSIRKTINAK